MAAVPQQFNGVQRLKPKFGFWWSVPKAFAANVLPMEGGLVINPAHDSGGNTNKGIIWATYAGGGYYVLGKPKPNSQEMAANLSNDFKNLTDQEVYTIVEKLFYNNEDLPSEFGGVRYNLGKIHDESIQMIILYSIWGSGFSGQNTVRKMQEFLGVTQDNQLGPQTIKAVNALSQAQKEELAKYLIESRWDFLTTIREVGTNRLLIDYFPGWIKAVWFLQDFDSYYRQKKK